MRSCAMLRSYVMLREVAASNAAQKKMKFVFIKRF
jgi:hypothetical protein